MPGQMDRGPEMLPGHPRHPRGCRERQPPGDVGEEPDPRFTFANERTFLAWNRTALALVAAGAAAAAFLRTELGSARMAVALPLILLGAAVSLASHRRWERVERALRLGRPIPYSPIPRALGMSIGILSLVVAGAVLIDALLG